ncbi:GP46-like surface antigen, putative, partial [Bodo saltans]
MASTAVVTLRGASLCFFLFVFFASHMCHLATLLVVMLAMLNIAEATADTAAQSLLMEFYRSTGSRSASSWNLQSDVCKTTSVPFNISNDALPRDRQRWDPQQHFYCNWFGVQCTVSNSSSVVEGSPPTTTTTIVVTKISLQSCGLGGTLPAVLLQSTPAATGVATPAPNTNPPPQGGATSNITVSSVLLDTLELQNNQIAGTLPDAYGTATSALTTFLVDNNKIRGALPSSFGDLFGTSLTLFDVSNNAFSGTLPLAWKTWSQVSRFVAVGNQLTGTIPPDWSMWNNSITYFDIGGNALSGSLPRTLRAWSKLMFFSVSYNKLTGTLPPEYSEWSSLQTFWVYGNSLSGPLPSVYSNWKAIVTNVGFSGNQFSGTLPESWLQWSSLSYFDVSINSLTGTLPASYSNWTLNFIKHKLEALQVFSNALSGTFPSFFVSASFCSSLVTLDVRDNHLSGGFPLRGVIMNCSSLRNLYLSNNFFNGSFFNNLPSIAAEVKATNIQELFIAFNKFTGTVPNDDTLVTLFPNMTMFHIFENQFIGVMPILPVIKWKYLTEYRVSSNNFTSSNLSTFDNEIVSQYRTTDQWNCSLKVFSMSFNKNVTSGSLPKSLSACTNMSTFEATEINMGGGTLPDDYGRAWAGSITTFSLVRCNLSGTVPMSYSQWSLIEQFDVGVNSSLHGDLSFANKWRALKIIRLESNLFTGTIPGGFSKNINLTQLWLNVNQLHGTLDSAFGAGCPALRYFYVHTNNFSGTIPMEFASWPVMERFYIQNNRFEGTLQKAWAQWGPTFAEMNIGNNSFSGNLPAEWSAWGNVVVLMAAINSISGVLPISWEKMKYLGTLALDANQLTGTLPSQWSGLSSMDMMSLTYNQLSGQLPREWASLAKLRFLGLQGNANISGAMPTEWKQQLSFVYISICSTALYGSPWAPTVQYGLLGLPSQCFPCITEGTDVSSLTKAVNAVKNSCNSSWNGMQTAPPGQLPLQPTPSTSSAAPIPPPSPSPARDAAGVSIIVGAGVVAILGGDPASAQMLVTLLMSSCMCGYSGDGGALSSGGSDDGVFATIVSSLTLSPFSSLGNAAMAFGNGVLMFALVGLHALLVVLLGRCKERQDRRKPHSDNNNVWRDLCTRPEASAAKFPNICVTCGLFLVPGVVRGSVMVLGTSRSS